MPLSSRKLAQRPQLSHAPDDHVFELFSGQSRGQRGRFGAQLDEFFAHGAERPVQLPVVIDGDGALLELFIDAAKAALQRFGFFLEDRVDLLANLITLLMERFVDMNQIDFHLENDIHQALDRLSVHGFTFVAFQERCFSACSGLS